MGIRYTEINIQQKQSNLDDSFFTSRRCSVPKGKDQFRFVHSRVNDVKLSSTHGPLIP